MKVIKVFVASLALALAVSAKAADKPTVVLVHGSFQTSRGWDRVGQILTKKGFKVVAINFPGRGGDPTPVEQITADTYRDKVLEVINAEAAPVVLVGHSFGGLAISNTAESAPSKIKSLVYLAAYFPKDGESLQSLSKLDSDSKAGKYFVLSPDYKWASIADDGKALLFANDAVGADKKMIADSLVREPAAPTGMPAKLTEGAFGSVTKYYIKTKKDNLVSPMLQDLMIKNHKVEKVYSVNAGHGAYVTHAADVAKIIAEIANK